MTNEMIIGLLNELSEKRPDMGDIMNHAWTRCYQNMDIEDQREFLGELEWIVLRVREEREKIYGL